MKFRFLIRVGLALVLGLAASSAKAMPVPVDPGPPVEASQPAVPLSANGPLSAQPAGANPNQLTITGLGGGSAQWTIVVLLTFLTLIPSILICMTPFARLLIVFHFLRQALGLQTTPSNQTLVGLSMIMTVFLMQPVGNQIYKESIVPLQANKITPMDAIQTAAVPMRTFMAHYVREKDVAMFLDIAKEPRPKDINDISFRVLLPAYILSELKAGFQIGAVLFLPFLVIDMVVASITTSVGMMQLPPVVISTPLKLLLFLMVDGWHLLVGALMRSFS
ncbi:MAG TPA: flagellar type III secretion system pore protein FliP [Acidobacteriaceae bacterium]